MSYSLKDQTVSTGKFGDPKQIGDMDSIVSFAKETFDLLMLILGLIGVLVSVV